jgi:TonB family protein
LNLLSIFNPETLTPNPPQFNIPDVKPGTGYSEAGVSTMTKHLASIIVSASLAFSVAAQQTAPAIPNQQEFKPETLVAMTGRGLNLDEKEAADLHDKLASATEQTIQIIERNQAPVTITDARVRGVKREPPPATAEYTPKTINDYAMRAEITLTNSGERRVTGVGLRFTNSQAQQMFDLYPKPVAIEPGQNQQIIIRMMCVTGDPVGLTVGVANVEFDDKTVWGGYPFPEPAPAPSAPAAPVWMPDQRVDSKPRPLNSPGPHYTEEARRNHVTGAVVLVLLIGSDGNVKMARTVNSLPDFLTEEALRAAFQLKFAPAMKNGQAVDYWMRTNLEFMLK